MTNTSPVFYKLSLHTLSLKFTTVFQVFLNCSFKSFLWTLFRHTATHLHKLWLKWLDAHTRLAVNVLTYTPGGGCAHIHAWWWTCSHTRLVVNVLTYTPGGERAYIHAWWWTCLHTHLVVDVFTYTPGGERAHIHAWWWTCSHTRLVVNMLTCSSRSDHTQHGRWTAMYKWWDLFPQCPVSTDPKLHRHNIKRKIPVLVIKLLYKLFPSCLLPSNAV